MLSWFVLIGGTLGCQEYSLGDDVYVVPEDSSSGLVDLGPVGQAPMYANSSTELFAIDPSNDSIELVGSFDLDGVGVERFVDLAMDLDGRLFGGTYDAIYEIGATNGRLRFHCSTQAELTAMAFGTDGTLYVGGGSIIEAMNLEDCAVTTAFELEAFETSGDLVGTPDGMLYWSVEGDGEDELVRLDPSDSSSEWIGTLGAQRLYGLGYADGDLFGFSSFGKVVRTSLGTPEEASVVATVDEAWWGATTNPVSW